MRVTEVDTRSVDDRTAAALAELMTVAEREAIPDEPPTPAAEVADDLRLAPGFRHHFRWIASDGDHVRAMAALDVEERSDNRHLAEIDVVVHPAERGRGLGSQLLVPVAERALELGRTQLIGYVPEGAPSAGFAEALGAKPDLVEHQNRLRTAELDRDLLDGWVAQAAQGAAGYSLVAWDGATSDDLVERVVAVLAAMNDAPMPSGMEDVEFSVDELRARERSHAERGDVTWRLCARDDATGDLAGITELYFLRHRPWRADQGDTGVLDAHRNRGIGRWLKAVNLLRLLDERPEVQVVETWNAGSNAAMLGINHALGFRAAAAWVAWTAEAEELRRRAGR